MVIRKVMNSRKEKIFDQNQLGDEWVENMVH
jgi:hypothetical protein